MTFSLLLLVASTAGAAEIPCDRYVDEQQVVHVRGAGELETFACLGYSHGRDRAWQMDFFRRTYQGRKAEVYGSDAIRSDFLMRLLGFDEQSKRLWEGLSPESKAKLESYARGATRGMADAAKAGVYEQVADGRGAHAAFEPWQGQNSLGLLLLQAFDQTRKSFELEFDEAETARIYGDAEAMRLLSPDGVPWETSILKKGEYEVAQKKRAALRAGLKDLFAGWEGLEDGAGRGSNNWVLAPQRSKSGKAWLANDPHLGIKTPPFWYWVHVEDGQGLDAIGGSLPGVPIIASGANRYAAWGLTNAYLDVAGAYAVDEAEVTRAAKSERPVIWFKAWKLSLPFFFKSLRRTPQGWPVLPLDGPEGKALVLRWSGQDLTPAEVESFLGVSRAKSARELDQVLSRVGLPTWNFVFADVKGEIGYRAIGRVPKRETPFELGHAPATLKDLESWVPLTADEMPHVLAPKRGYVVTANNRQWPEGSRFAAGRAHSPSFRAFRIEELLLKQSKHDLKSIQAVQCDRQAVDARFFVPRMLLMLRDSDPTEKKVAGLFRDWQKAGFPSESDCRACPVYRRWMDLWLEAAGVDENGLFRLLEPGSVADEDRDEGRDALRSALADIGVSVGSGSDVSTWPRWGDVLRIGFEHLSGDPSLDVSPLPGVGADHSVNPGTGEWDEKLQAYRLSSSASHRLVVELTNPPTVHAMLAGANFDRRLSDLAQPGSPWRKWHACELETRHFPLDWAKVPEAKIERVKL